MQDMNIREQLRVAREDHALVYLAPPLLLVVFGLYIYLGYLEGIFYWSLWFVLSVLLTKLTCRLLSTPLSLVRFCIFSYLALTIIGLILIVFYRSLYNMDFAPWADDSHYFLKISKLATRQDYTNVSATLYEYIVSAWYMAVQMTKSEPVLLDIIPVNWAVGTMIMVLSYALSYEVTKFRCPLFLVSVTLLGNCTLTDTVVNLYRDGMVILFCLVVMLAVVRNRIIIGLVGTALAAGIRGANGMLMALFIIYSWACKSRLVARNWVLSSIILAVLGSAGIYLDQSFGLGSRLRDITGASSIAHESETISARAMKRAQWRVIGGGKSQDSSDMMQVFANKIPGGSLALPVLTMFAPARLPELTRENMGCNVYLPSGRTKRFTASGIYPPGPFRWITVFLWVVIAPYLVMGLVAAFFGTAEERKFLTLFIMTLLAITYVSMLARHRLIFIVLYPIFVTLGYKSALKHPNVRIAGRIITVVIIVVAHLATLIV